MIDPIVAFFLLIVSLFGGMSEDIPSEPIEPIAKYANTCNEDETLYVLEVLEVLPDSDGLPTNGFDRFVSHRETICIHRDNFRR